MKSLIFVGTLCLLFVVVFSANDTTTEGATTQAPKTEAPKTTATTEAAKTTATTEAPNKKTTATTEAAKTTVTTEAAKTTATTVAGTTGTEGGTTQAAVTTAETPTMAPTLPTPTQGKWEVKQNGTVCIRMDAAIQIKIQYMLKATNKTDNVTYNVATDAVATGTCGNETQTLQLALKTSAGTWNPVLVFYFRAVGTDQFAIENTTFSFTRTAKKFPDAKDKGDQITGRLDQTLFTVSKTNSYQCKSEIKNRMTNDVFLDTSNVQAQAFMKKGDKDFGAEVACAEDSVTSNIVPIAVGAALAGLVVIVLIAYLIGRRRNQRGYESV